MTTPQIASQAFASKAGGSIQKLVAGNFQFASAKDFATPRVALFIHGFTADAAYMRQLMEQFASNGFTSLAYNYPCYDGFDYAAQSLRDLVEKFDGLSDTSISKNKMIVVGHSMGGLVARAFVALEGGHKYTRKLFTLGTPHAGTLVNSRFIPWLVAWGESLSGLVRGGFSMSSRSALQLMGADGDPPLLERLRQAAIPGGSVEFHSISGGKNYLTFNANAFYERVLNIVIQQHLKSPANDGLVLEASSDLSGPQFASCASGCVHHKTYADYKKLNHSHLCQSQVLNLEILAHAY